jgi:hypothetical protein
MHLFTRFAVLVSDLSDVLYPRLPGSHSREGNTEPPLFDTSSAEEFGARVHKCR